MRISLKTINSELEQLGSQAVLAKGDGYFYFLGGEATDWLDRTVRVPTLHSLTLEQWIEQYRVLSEKNQALLKGAMAASKPETEYPVGRRGVQSSDCAHKHRLVASKKPEPRPGKKRNSRQRTLPV